LRWSPDGKQLAFLGYSATRENPPRLYQVDVARRSVHEHDLADIDSTPVVRLAPQIEWTGDGSLMLLAARRVAGKRLGVEDRRDWWLIASDGTTHNLTEKATKVSSELWALHGRSAFVGLADGKIWRITPATAKLENLSESLATPISRIVWPLAEDAMGDSQSASPGAEFSEIIFATGEGKEVDLNLLDLRSGVIQPIHKPSPSASLNAFDPPRREGVFTTSDSTGTFLWRSAFGENAPFELGKANTFLADIAPGLPQSIEYTSLDGEKLKGWIILPYNYEKGRRYPTLTWVYAGSVAKSTPTVLANIDFFNPLSLQIPVSHGYAVLIPSMPLKPEGEVDDPMLRLMNGVIPAVDKGVELGTIDPDRLFVMGQSFGGFSTYGLITQTNRFKAAVALAGLSDLISLYGQFDARQRYGPYPQEDLFMDALLEGAQGNMGSPPWKDFGRYIRNSPIFFVDRVQTPVLIIQGDFDYVACNKEKNSSRHFTAKDNARASFAIGARTMCSPVPPISAICGGKSLGGVMNSADLPRKTA
jgi:dipeptidyl aminopeptidase/acylaminoacyl peptidase